MSLFCLQSETTFATSAAPLAVHRPPLSTTLTVFAPSDLMSANEPVWVAYQVCAWLVPRMTNALPFASRIRVPLTWRPVAAWAGGTERRNGNRSAASSANLVRMTYLGWGVPGRAEGSSRPAGALRRPGKERTPGRRGAGCRFAPRAGGTRGPGCPAGPWCGSPGRGRSVPPARGAGRRNGGQPVVQVTGTGTPLVPFWVPVKPKDVEAFGASVPFQLRFLTDTSAPVWVCVPLQS